MIKGSHFYRIASRSLGLVRSIDWQQVHFSEWRKLYELYSRREYARKKYWGLHKFSRDCQTVILGSSHAYHGFYANGSEYNLGDYSCNFYYSAKLLQYWLFHGLPKLRNVVLFCDIFSSGDVLEKSSEAFRAAQIHNLYGIDYQCEMPKVVTLGLEFSKLDALYSKIRNRPMTIEDGYRGNLDFGKEIFNCTEDLAEARVRRHLKIGEEREQVKWLDLVAKEAKNFNLTLVIPPLSSAYMRYLPSFNIAYAYLIEWLETCKVARLCNCWNSSAFSDKDFGDIDHLNERGAKKLSNIIRNYFD